MLTLRTDEIGLFWDWKTIGNPNFKIFYSSSGNFQTRIALTEAMMKLAGAEAPPEITLPSSMRQVDETTCNPDVPGETPASSLVPLDTRVLAERIGKQLYRRITARRSVNNDRVFPNIYVSGMTNLPEPGKRRLLKGGQC